MAFRTLTSDNAAEIHVRGGQLTVQRERDELPLQIALDDIACIVLANLDITLSTGALDMISQRGITILGCGCNYMPTSIMPHLPATADTPKSSMRSSACPFP